MTDAEGRSGSAVRILGAADASAAIDQVIDTMRALEKVLAEETALLKGGRIRDALALETQKAGLAGAYMRGLETVKANALIIARQAPDGMTALKAAHEEFSQVVALNHAVLATAHAVSEGLMRNLASESGNQPRASGYGPGASARAAPRQAAPLAGSRKA